MLPGDWTILALLRGRQLCGYKLGSLTPLPHGHHDTEPKKEVFSNVQLGESRLLREVSTRAPFSMVSTSHAWLLSTLVWKTNQSTDKLNLTSDLILIMAICS